MGKREVECIYIGLLSTSLDEISTDRQCLLNKRGFKLNNFRNKEVE